MPELQNDSAASIDSVCYYEVHGDAYAAVTLYADVGALYQEFEKCLSIGSRILDLGCGSGRDSRYFASQGYDVIAVDPSSRMCAITEANAAVPVYTMRAEELSFENEFDAVWACASLLHVPRVNQVSALQRISRALKPGGVLYASWKYGTQDRCVNGRFFTDMDESTFQAVLAQVQGFERIKSWISVDVRPDQKEQKWLNVLVKKTLSL